MEILRIQSEFSKKRKQQLPLNKTLLLPHILTSPNDGKKRQKKKPSLELQFPKNVNEDETPSWNLSLEEESPEKAPSLSRQFSAIGVNKVCNQRSANALEN